MRPICHPHPDEITVQGILYALSDPVRVQILSGLMGAGCSRSCKAFTNVGQKPLAKSTLSQHFRILREAGLIRSERNGVELRNSMRCDEIETRYGPMVRAILAAFKSECAARSRAARRAARSK